MCRNFVKLATLSSPVLITNPLLLLCNISYLLILQVGVKWFKNEIAICDTLYLGRESGHVPHASAITPVKTTSFSRAARGLTRLCSQGLWSYWNKLDVNQFVHEMKTNKCTVTESRCAIFLWFCMYSRLCIKRLPYKNDWQTLEAYNSKTKRTRTILTWIKKAYNSIFHMNYINAFRDCVKEDHCDTAGLSKNRSKWVFLYGIDYICIYAYNWRSIFSINSRSENVTC